MISVETPRLLLRLPEETDAGPFVIIHQDPEVLEKKAALHWAWLSTDINHIISPIAPDNPRSIRVATKVGEIFERADQDPVHGEPISVYGIHRPG